MFQLEFQDSRPYWGVFRGPLGVLGVLWDPEGSGASGAGLGGPRDVPGGSWEGLGKGHFLFVKREFVNCLEKY